VKAVEVVAINGEKMILPVSEVRMIGPLMDRGMAMLGRSVLYLEGLPPLPVKELRRDIAARLGWEVSESVDMGDEGALDSRGADGSSDGGSEAGLVVGA
jgi:hypothetical protein